MTEKRCPRCEIVFRRKAGCNGYCPPCAADVNREWRLANPERVKAIEARKLDKRKEART